jgi:hypothetical protein
VVFHCEGEVLGVAGDKEVGGGGDSLLQETVAFLVFRKDQAWQVSKQNARFSDHVQIAFTCSGLNFGLAVQYHLVIDQVYFFLRASRRAAAISALI